MRALQICTMELDLLKRPILRADLTHRPLSDTNLHALDASRPVKQQEEGDIHARAAEFADCNALFLLS